MIPWEQRSGRFFQSHVAAGEVWLFATSDMLNTIIADGPVMAFYFHHI